MTSILPLTVEFALSAAGQVAFKHREQRLLGVPVVPSGCHRPQGHRRRNAEKGGQIQTGRTLSRPLLPAQEEWDGEVFPGVQCNVDPELSGSNPTGDHAQQPAADRPQQEALQRGRTPPPSGD